MSDVVHNTLLDWKEFVHKHQEKWRLTPEQRAMLEWLDERTEKALAALEALECNTKVEESLPE
jgi:hypothetical protein